MSDEQRQRMNVRIIRVTLAAALRYAPPGGAAQCVERARQLLAEARNQTTVQSVLAEIDALQSHLDSRRGSVAAREYLN